MISGVNRYTVVQEVSASPAYAERTTRRAEKSREGGVGAGRGALARRPRELLGQSWGLRGPRALGCGETATRRDGGGGSSLLTAAAMA